MRSISATPSVGPPLSHNDNDYIIGHNFSKCKSDRMFFYVKVTPRNKKKKHHLLVYFDWKKFVLIDLHRDSSGYCQLPAWYKLICAFFRDLFCILPTLPRQHWGALSLLENDHSWKDSKRIGKGWDRKSIGNK